MSNGHKWELLPNIKEGGAFLNYWDAINGNDVTIEIMPTGVCLLVWYVEDTDGVSRKTHKLIPNLGKFLVAWMAENG